MTASRPLTPAAKLNAVFLFAAAAGIILQVVVGVPGYPAVPPGPIILAAAGVLVLTLSARFRWIAPAFILVGGILEGSIWGRLGTPTNFVPLLGTALQEIGVIAALICAVIAITQTTRTPTTH